jgi:hypothetical protein
VCCKQSVFLSVSHIQVISNNVTAQILKCKICHILQLLPLSYTHVYKSQMTHSYSVYGNALHCAYQCTQDHTYLPVIHHSERSRKIIIKTFTHLGQPKNDSVRNILCYRISTQTPLPTRQIYV